MIEFAWFGNETAEFQFLDVAIGSNSVGAVAALQNKCRLKKSVTTQVALRLESFDELRERIIAVAQAIECRRQLETAANVDRPVESREPAVQQRKDTIGKIRHAVQVSGGGERPDVSQDVNAATSALGRALATKETSSRSVVSGFIPRPLFSCAATV